jgi:hypothetical protein
MHSILARLYHLTIGVALHPIWNAPVAALLTALFLRPWRGPDRFYVAPIALLAGWLELIGPAIALSPAKPVDRLPGLAIILLLHAWLSPRAGSRVAALRLPALAAMSAWWIAGASLTSQGLATSLPVFLGVWAALTIAARLTTKDRGFATIGAALALSAAIFFAGGAPHWVGAAFLPACVGVALLGLPNSTPPLAFATMLTAGLAVLASNRGRFLPMDVAVLAPILVWVLVPHLAFRLSKASGAVAAAIATGSATALAFLAIKLLSLR